MVGVVGAGLAMVNRSAEPYGLIDGEGTLPLMVAVAPARHQEAFETVHEFVGTVEARRRSDLGFELAGELAVITVDEGDVVEHVEHHDRAAAGTRQAQIAIAAGTDAQRQTFRFYWSFAFNIPDE